MSGPTRGIFAYAQAIFAVAVVTGICFSLRQVLLPSNLGAFYLLLVCWLAYQLGRGPSLLASALGATIFDFCFVSPYYALELRDREYIFTFLSLLGVSLLISSLTARAREQALAARSREREAVAVLEFSRALSDVQGEAAIGSLITEQLSQRLGGRAEFVPCESEKGSSDGTKAEGAHYPLISRSGEPLGDILWSGAQGQDASVQQRLLETFSRQAALALERERLVHRAQQAEINSAAEQLESTLLNCISHDLRSPLVAIQGALESLQNEQQAPLQSHDRALLLDNAIQETDRLNRFVANLMQMTRLESGHLLLRLEPQDLAEVVEATLRQLRYPPRIKVNLDPELPLVQADFLLLQQSFWNLLVNALKFAHDGPIHVEATAMLSTVEVCIRDFGPGIAESHRDLAFSRFYRGNPEIKGSGLGLPICRGLLKAMGGSVEVEDAAPGARFRLTLQMAEL